jgi:hypothetical protein
MLPIPILLVWIVPVVQSALVTVTSGSAALVFSRGQVLAEFNPRSLIPYVEHQTLRVGTRYPTYAMEMVYCGLMKRTIMSRYHSPVGLPQRNAPGN